VWALRMIADTADGRWRYPVVRSAARGPRAADQRLLAMVRRLAGVTQQYSRQWPGCLRRAAFDEVWAAARSVPKDCFAWC
jgi:hypothetical protein